MAYSHSIRECNFNGGAHHIVAAGAFPNSIRDSEFEGASDDCIVFSYVRHYSKGGVGRSNAHVASNIIAPTQGRSCVRCISLGTLTMLDNLLGNSTAPKVVGMTTIYSYFGRTSDNKGGPMFDGSGTKTDSDFPPS